MFGKVSLFSQAECEKIISDLTALEWSVGMSPSSLYREEVKRNREISLQMSEHTVIADEHMKTITRKIMESQFLSDRLFPKSMVSPKFNRYGVDEQYRPHADASLMGNARNQVRTDISITLFLSDPKNYEGGELELCYPSGSRFKLKEPAGTLVFYPSGVMHQVHSVTAGERVAFIAWIESKIQNPQQRELLTEITLLCRSLEENPETALSEAHVQAQNIKHNLFRMWWHN